MKKLQNYMILFALIVISVSAATENCTTGVYFKDSTQF